MALRGRKPEVKVIERAKLLISGGAGEGKTHFSLQFPQVYYIDSEGGAKREQYQELLIKSGGTYMGVEEGASDFGEVIREVKTLATEKHPYKTVVIDSLSHLYNLEAAIAEVKVGSAYGADRKEANKPCRQLLRWIEKIDMNVVLICHEKADWTNKDKDGNVGTTYDAYDKVQYALDLWLELKDKKFIARKTRLTSFTEGMKFGREYSEFSEMFGQKHIEKEVETLIMSTPEEIQTALKFAKGLNYTDDDLAKLFKKVDVDSWEDMSKKQIQSCIKFLADKIDKLQGGK